VPIVAPDSLILQCCHNAPQMESLLPVAAVATLHRIRRIQSITIAWMSVEAVVSLSAAWMAHSPALLAFGGDSAIELVSAVVVYWRFRSKWIDERTEKLAARITGWLLFALIAYVALVAALALLGHREVRPSLLGIAVLSVAAVGMPQLAQQKRRLSALTASAALRADAVESVLCGYLSVIALAGLVANAVWGITCRSCGCTVRHTAGCAGGLAGSRRKPLRLLLTAPHTTWAGLLET
jgi:divalent metal cation (Fe/Co/Zn/Cd) transporter